MAEHVEVVIKIPKYYLTHPQDYSCLAECVRRGAILPKGHGRLIDADKVENITWQEPYYHDALNVLSEVRDKVRELSTIIEADKAESEEEDADTD